MDERRLSELMTALADPNRRSALALLAGGEELCVCELMAALDVSQSRMSRHMAALKAAGLVSDRRDAQWVRYRIERQGSVEVERIVEAVLAGVKFPIVRTCTHPQQSRQKELVS